MSLEAEPAGNTVVQLAGQAEQALVSAASAVLSGRARGAILTRSRHAARSRPGARDSRYARD
jgi:hypothetical protein